MQGVKKFVFGFYWIFISLSQVIASGDHPWCYNEEKCAPSNWGGICHTGHAQSPIDFTQAAVSHSRHLRRIRVNQEYLQGYPDFYIKNNGHTIQVQLREDLTSDLRMDSDGFRGTKYELSQLHFHWGSRDNLGSEHTINGTGFPMELHLVHFSDKYANLLQAVTDQNPRALAVFGVFFEISPEDNPSLTPIVEALSIVDTYHPDPTIFKGSVPLNYSSFFPSVMDVYRYEGSLTTPSCGQKVVWTVFKYPVPISEKQMEAFRSVKDTFGHALADNFRPTQPLGRRKIYENIVTLLQFQESVPKDEVDQGVRSSDNSNENNQILQKTKYTTHDHHEPDTQHQNSSAYDNQRQNSSTHDTQHQNTTTHDHKSSTCRIRMNYGSLIAIALTLSSSLFL